MPPGNNLQDRKKLRARVVVKNTLRGRDSPSSPVASTNAPRPRSDAPIGSVANGSLQEGRKNEIENTLFGMFEKGLVEQSEAMAPRGVVEAKRGRV